MSKRGSELLMQSQVKLITGRGMIMFAVPLIGLFTALSTRNLLILDYVHVLSGATWTGIDIFMGFVMAFVFRYISPPARGQIATRLTPVMLFLMPSLATTAVTAGIYLAKTLGVFSLHSPLIIAAGIIVLILIAQGFGLFLPNEVRVFLELRRENPDINKISRLMSLVFKLGGIQGIFQIALIFVMASLATA